MGVRLNKVLTELNIGLQTAVDFLKNKKELGEVKDDTTSNTKISDEQYSALVKEFKGDKDIKTQAQTLFPKKPKPEKKPEKPAITKAEDLLEQRPQFKPLGKIDLETVGKPKAAPAAEPAAPVAEKPQPQPQPEPEPEAPVAVQPEEEKAPVVEAPAEEHVAEAPQEPVAVETAPAEEAPAEQATPKEPAIFTLKSEAKLAPKVNVLGKIDLSTINQSTRPKKKTKEEKRKERAEKAAGGEKKKRVRIGKERVDIEAEPSTSRRTSRRTRAATRTSVTTVASRAARTRRTRTARP